MTVAGSSLPGAHIHFACRCFRPDDGVFDLNGWPDGLVGARENSSADRVDVPIHRHQQSPRSAALQAALLSIDEAVVVKIETNGGAVRIGSQASEC